MKNRICSLCGYVGKPTHSAVHTFMFDILVWIIVGWAAVKLDAMLLLAIPFILTSYHAYQSVTTKCPKCDNAKMVKLNSEKAHAVLQQRKQRLKSRY